MLKLNSLSSPKGTTRNRKRIGRGQSSGQGTQAGKGHKGQKARGSGKVRPGFSGGGKPLYMRLPKVGFNNANFTKKFAIVPLDILDKKFSDGQEVSRTSLIAQGILKGVKRHLPIKVLQGNLSRPLNFVEIDSFSQAARAKIEACGGSIKNSNKGKPSQG